MPTKMDSYIEFQEKGLRVVPVIIWFEKVDDTTEVYVFMNGDEVRYNIDDSDIHNIHTILPYEMTIAARMQWMKLSSEDEYEIYMESIKNILKDCIHREYQTFMQPTAFSDTCSMENIPFYTRHFFEQFSLKATYDPTYTEECRLTYVWRGTNFPTLQHVLRAIAMDYEIIKLISRSEYDS
jgi:hypothetical protein